MQLDPAIFQPILERAAWLGLVIALDLILGVAVALKSRTFEWQKLANFLETYGIKILGWLAVEALNFLPDEYKQIGNVVGIVGAGVYGLLFLSAAASVVGHVQAIFGASFLSRAGLPPTTQA